jgi:flagellar M-ring protein FliF
MMRSLLERWRGLEPRRRLAAGALALLAVVGIVAAAALERDSRVPLFAVPLLPEQVTEVVERLAEWNVPFVAATDNVRVDAKRRNDLLLRLAVAGVPHPHLETSREALAKAGPLTPQSVLDAQEREGLAGDLAAGIRGMAGVADAQVIVAPAHDPTYPDESAHGASASVRISLRPGAVLSRVAIDGIRQFVAAGVPGLEAKRVAIVDDRGLALGDDAPGGSDESQALQGSLQSALDLALGAGAAIVRVRAAYDQRTRELRDLVREPLGNRPIGTTTVDEHYQSASKRYAKRHTNEDRGSEVRDERTDVPAGRLEHLSVAILVDASRRLDLAKIRSLATGTLGLAPVRGDTLAVEEVAFAKPGPHAFAPLAAALGFVAALAPTVVLVAALLLGVRWSAKPMAAALETLVQRVSVGKAARTITGFAPAQVRGALENEPPHTAAAIISALPAATATAVLELYPAEERAAIVRRMARGVAPVVPDYEAVLRRG